MTKAKSNADSDCKSKKDPEKYFHLMDAKKNSNPLFLEPFSERFKGFGRGE